MFERLEEELQFGETETFSSQAAKSLDTTPRTTSTSRRDKHFPDQRKMEDNWELYRDFGLVRASIRGFASEVISPGYYVDAESEKVREDLEDWLENCSIISGEHDKDFRELGKKSTIQREVRGTALIEKVPSKDGNLYGFKMINPEKVRAYTKPGQAILLEPDEDIEKLGEENEDFAVDDVKTTANGDIAAYVQWDASLSTVTSNKTEIPFTKDQIIKLTRDEDVGEIFGNSRLESVKARAESLLEKMENNDDAIRATAHPFWLFKMGGEDDPWTEEEIKEFMKHHDGDEFSPGMKQAVQGNVDIDTISGDVAEIQDFLEFDVNMIMSEMPIPKYALGAFEEDVNQFVSRSQETELRKQVREARQELESEFTPVLKEKAKELGHSEEDVNRLKIGIPPEERRLDENGNPRMDSEGDFEPAADAERPNDEADPRGDPARPSTGNDPETDMTRPPASTEMDEFSEHGAWVSNEFEELSRLTEQFLMEVRDSSLLELERHDRLLEGDNGGFRESKAKKVERLIETQVSRAAESFDFETAPMEVFESVVADENAEYVDSGQGLVGRSFSVDREAVRNYAGNYRNSVEDFAEEFAKEVRREFRRSYNRGEDVDVAVERIREDYNNDALSQRASIISMMEVHGARQASRLEIFEDEEEIVGYRIVNDNPHTELTRSVDGIEVYFDEGDYVGQVEAQLNTNLLPQRFTPPPVVPPYRMGDSSYIQPIYKGEV